MRADPRRSKFPIGGRLACRRRSGQFANLDVADAQLHARFHAVRPHADAHISSRWLRTAFEPRLTIDDRRAVQLRPELTAPQSACKYVVTRERRVMRRTIPAAAVVRLLSPRPRKNSAGRR